MQTKRLIDANTLKELREKFIRGEIHFDDEWDMIDRCPTVDAVFVVRCKDCRYRGMIYCPAVHETMGNGLVDYTSDEAYCWRGCPKEYTNAT